MNFKGCKELGVVLAALALTVNYSPWIQQRLLSLPAAQAVSVQTSQTAERVLIPGGQAVGVALHTRGVLVVAKAQDGSPDALRVGDVILTVGGVPVESARQLAEQVGALEAETVALGVQRGGRQMVVQADARTDGADGRKRLGIWVRDSTAGVGTLSYVDPETGAYGALGHAIVDADTGDLFDVQDGAIMNASVVGVTKGQSGKAGELRGSFLRENEQIGTLEENGTYGIYGRMKEEIGGMLYPEGLPVGTRAQVHTGPATIIATVDGEGPREYAVEIVRCFAQSEPSPKGMILRVTDETLLAKTGGIVQGMSCSPILQEGRLVGAVTHVYLNDSTQGYGMYIEWMLRQSDTLTADGSESAA